MICQFRTAIVLNLLRPIQLNHIGAHASDVIEVLMVNQFRGGKSDS